MSKTPTKVTWGVPGFLICSAFAILLLPISVPAAEPGSTSILLGDMPKDEVPTPGESIVVPPELWNPLDTRPEAAVVTFPPASTPNFWKNRVLTFHKEVYAGNEYTQAAQLSTDANLNFVLYLFSGQTYGGTTCERSVLNSLHGTLRLFTSPQLWIKLPGTGVQEWRDTCNQAIDQDVPLRGSYAWNVYPLDGNGLRFEFQNANYHKYGYIEDFVFRRIK